MVTAAHGLHHRCRSGAGDAKRHAAVLHVGARDVKLYGRYAVEFIDAGGALGIVFGRRTAHVDNHVGVNVLYLRIYMLAEIVHALVLQAHAVEHSAGGFGHTRIVVALARMQRSAFHDDAADAVEGHEVGKFQSVAKRSRCGHHGIFQAQSFYFYIQSCHSSCLMLNTGPSLHTQRLPSTVFSTQQRQAPSPQAIMFSSETSQSTPALAA